MSRRPADRRSAASHSASVAHSKRLSVTLDLSPADWNALRLLRLLHSAPCSLSLWRATDRRSAAGKGRYPSTAGAPDLDARRYHGPVTARPLTASCSVLLASGRASCGTVLVQKTGGSRIVWRAFKRWLYRGGRPHALARVLNRGWATLHAKGIAPNYLVTLEVRGRRSGRVISFPLVMVPIHGDRYLVSMLGEDTAWVRNVRAAGGHAVLRHGRTETVRLMELEADKRALVLKAYLQRAPGARPHIPVHKDAPLEAFERVAGQIPVFRVIPAG